MKKLPIFVLSAAVAAVGAVGCDRDKGSRSSTSPESGARTAAARQDSDVATNPSKTIAPGINPGSATDAGQNQGATASNGAGTNNPAASNAPADNTNLSRGNASLSSSGAPVANDNTGTTLNPHRIEDNAQTAAAQSNLDPQEFVKEAASGGLFEVQSSQLALKKSNDQAVKDFAQQMINDHEKANDQLKNIAKGENITVSDQLLPKHQQLLDRLNNASSDFDKQYDQIQKQAHEETVTLFQNASRSLSDPQLKSFASQTLPTLQQHLQHANQLPQ